MKVAIIVLSFLAFGVTSFVLGRDMAARGEELAGAHTRLVQSTSMPPLRAYIRCAFQASCRRLYGEEASTGEPFPMRLGMLWLFSMGGIVGGFLVRPKVQLYDGALARLRDVNDLRLRFWLQSRRARYGILLGRHVTVPDEGPERRPTLRGERGRAVDGRMMVLARGYGGRRELPSVAVFGTTRSGKSLQLTAQILRWLGSGVFLDIKGELHRYTAGVKARHGEVFVLSPDGRGNQFNPVAELIADDGDLDTAATIIAAPHREKGDGVFFAEKAAQALTAAFLAARVEGVPPFDMLYQIVLKGGLGSFVERVGQHDDSEVRLALNTFLDPHGGEDFDLQRILADKGLAASYSTMTSRLGPFLKPSVRYLLRKSDIRAHELMERPCYVYVQWPEATIESSLAVYDLVMTGLLRGMIRHVDRTLKGTPPRVPVFMGLDEIYKAPLMKLPGDLSTAAGRDILIALYCQTLGQLKDAFGEGGKETILDNCAVKLFYKTEGPEVAQYVSSLAHKVSRTEERRTRRWRLLPEVPTVSEGNQSREVITPDEVMLVGGKERELLIAAVTGKPLMVARRVDLREEPRLMRLMKRYPAPPIKVPSEREVKPWVKKLPPGLQERTETAASDHETSGKAEEAEPVSIVRPKEPSNVLERMEAISRGLDVPRAPERSEDPGAPEDHENAQPSLFDEQREEPSRPSLNKLVQAGLQADAARKGEKRA